VFPVTQLHEKPRAASDELANALIDDIFENVNSDLLKTVHPHLSHFGKY